MSFYVTTPIYYVNAEPHLGHAYSTIAADVLARHHRQRGDDVFFLTGTDEHGEPVALAAERRGSPRGTSSTATRRVSASWPSGVDASNDFFIRTTDPEHMAKVQEVVQRVHDNGHVYEGALRGLVLPALRRLQDRGRARPGQHLPDPRDPADLGEPAELVLPPQRVPGRRSSASTPSTPTSSRPDFRRNEALSFIERGLQDVSLSRPKLSWGVPVPWDPEQVIYVWWDALLNYYTALSYARDGEDLTERYWPASLHIIAKDILKFHTVYLAGVPARGRDRAAASMCTSTASC